MIIVIARFSPRPDRREALVALLVEVQAASREDDGCLHYGYFSEVADPLSFVAVEQWRDRDALAEHLRRPHVAQLIAALPELGDGRPDIQVHSVADSEPMRLSPTGARFRARRRACPPQPRTSSSGLNARRS